MKKRTLTITIRADWQNRLREEMRRAKAGLEQKTYRGESLNFETPGAFFSRLTPNRWSMISTLQEAGELGVRELARRLSRDVKRVHEDASVLVDLGIAERDESGALFCPYADIHVDMHLMRRAA